MTFHDCILNTNSEVGSHHLYELSVFEAPAVQAFRRMIDDFRFPLEDAGLAGIELQWSDYGANALATVYLRGSVASTSVMFTGRDADGETDLLRTMDRVLLGLTRPPMPLRMTERPLASSVQWPELTDGEARGVGHLVSCLAAAFFDRPAFVKVHKAQEPVIGPREIHDALSSYRQLRMSVGKAIDLLQPTKSQVEPCAGLLPVLQRVFDDVNRVLREAEEDSVDSADGPEQWRRRIPDP